MRTLRSASLLLVAGCVEPVISTFNEPPVVVIQQPQEDLTVPLGTTVELVGKVADDGPLKQILAQWLDNGTDVLASDLKPDAEGLVTLSVADLGEGAHALMLRAVDLEGLFGDATITVTVEKVVEAPTLVIVRPTDADRGQQKAPFTFEARVADAQDPPEVLGVEVASDKDGVLCTTTADEQGSAVCQGTPQTAGSHQLTFRVRDTDDHVTERITVLQVDPLRAEPVITITAPAQNALVRMGEASAMEATVADLQDPAEALSVAVASDRDGPLCTARPDATGEAACFGVVTSAGAHVLTFTVTDTEAHTASATRLVSAIDPRDVDDDGDGETENEGDCDDADATVWSGAVEQPDGLDEDCDGVADEGTVRFDDDGDGFCESLVVCTDGSRTGDCDDTAPLVHPDATESCLTPWDDDCDTSLDAEDATGCTAWFEDVDGDRFGDPEAPRCTCVVPASGSLNDDDCDDSLAAVNPGQAELPNGRDDDCDTVADEGTDRFDDDKDGYCESLVACTDGAMPGDCNDAAPGVNPGAAEICTTSYEEDCGADLYEEGAPGCTPWFIDADGDRYGDPARGHCTCDVPLGAVGNDKDCDDTSDAVFPGALELPNGVDDDCDTVADEGTDRFDDDKDGYCESLVACTDGALPGDCNDAAPAVNPGATETCATPWDDDCDVATDEEGATGCTTWYLDGDGDRFGRMGSPAHCTCVVPFNGVANDLDCNDDAPAIHPAMSDIANGLDDNCNGNADEGTTRYDNDGDGYCAASSCTPQPDGRTFLPDDCNDGRTDIHPGAAEVCNNGVDDNCLGGQDEGEDGPGCLDWWADNDNDGYGAGPGRCFCQATGVYKRRNANDCYDANPNAYPGQQQWFTSDRGDGSYDYDCDTKETPELEDEYQCECVVTIDFGIFKLPFTIDDFESGWRDTPDCGAQGTWYHSCRYAQIEVEDTGGFGFDFCIPGLGETASTQVLRQGCR
ncbi:MAG: putative metal-binding motif-containing protein [Alphaproteobacteria bacterium]|nr:putative metal-binding motif-containing protein [Alphaproteobacteria bacterium]